MILNAPAKLNLYLKVIQRRNDGYHEIETLFEKISIFDKIVIENSSNYTTIACNNPSVPIGEDSLLGRTIELFQEKSKNRSHFHITIEKNIPIGAGLGGGSSDAAALLKGLNQITGYPLQDKELEKIAQDLGADVPFFLTNASFGIGRSRGDIIEEIETDLDLWHIVVNPYFEVLTKDVYEKISLCLRRIEIKENLPKGSFSLTKPNGLDRMFVAFLKENDITGLAENLCNDLQIVVLRDFPVLNDIIIKLKSLGAKGVLLSGSGPTIFGIFDRDRVMKALDEAQRLFSAEKRWLVFLAQTYHIK